MLTILRFINCAAWFGRGGMMAAWLVLVFNFLISNSADAGESEAGESESITVFVNGYGFGSVLGDMETMSNAAVGIGWLVRGGIRMSQLGLFVECQRDHWMETDKDVAFNKGVLNFGMGADILLMNERIKISLAMGTSTLMFDTIFDKAGTTGVYIDFQPAVFRWHLISRLFLELSPIGAALQIPALSRPVLKRLQYRTSVGMEWQF